MTVETPEGIYLLLLRDAAAALGRSRTLADALSAVVALIAQRLGFDVCSIYLREPGGELVLEATHGLRPEAVGRVRLRPDEGLTGLVFTSERSFFTSQADRHPAFKFFHETGEERFRSFGGVPLLRGGECIGVLTVQTAREYAFPANEVVALETLAGQVVGIIGAARRLAGTRERPSDDRGTSGRLPRRGGDARVTLAGLGTSGGVGRGPARVLGEDPLDALPPARAFAGLDVELERFAQAQREAAARVGAEAERAETERGAVPAAILRAHVELIHDPTIAAQVRARIEGGAPAERAVHETLEACEAQLGALEDPHLRELVHDLRDVRGHLLRALGAGGDPGADVGEAAGVVVAWLLTPAETALLDPQRVAAIVTEHGSHASHASIVARSLGIPAVTAVPELLAHVAPGDRLLVDGDNGYVFVDPAPAVEEEYARREAAARALEERIARELASRLAAGPRVAGVSLFANAGLPGELTAARAAQADGIGLLRSELFFLQRDALPDLAEQTAFYRQVFREAPRGPVVVRLLDAGGDKVLEGLDAGESANPILGLRAVRLLLAHPELARTQVEAILRAAAAERADASMLVPLVTARWELEAVRELVGETAARSGLPALPLGCMVETPALLFVLPDLLELVDFVSVGTNDLTQYLLAVDRDDERVRHYYSSFDPAVLRALDHLRAQAAGGGKAITVCGEMAGSPLGALALLALGYRRLSARPRALPALRCLVHTVDPERLPGLRTELLAARVAADGERALRQALRADAPFLLEAL